MAEFPIDELVKCAEREVKQRKWVYPKQVASGRMTPALATRETLMMERIAEILRESATKGRLI